MTENTENEVKYVVLGTEDAGGIENLRYIDLPAGTARLYLTHQVAAATSALTQDEHETMTITTQLWAKLQQVVGDGVTRQADLHELVGHIHAIQRAIMSQAAGRLYPELYRTLGDELLVNEKETADGPES